MPFVLPSDPVTGQIAPVTWGDAVRDGLNFLANPPSVRVYHNASQNLLTGTDTAVTFNSERWDTDTMHDPAVNPTRITFKTAGLYVVQAGIRIQFNATGYRQLYFRLNGPTNFVGAYELHDAEVNSSQPDIFTMSTIWKFAVNDYIELMALQNSGATLTIDSATGSPEMAATWIGTG